MATINIYRHHNKSLADAKNAIDQIAKTIGQKFAIESTWIDNRRLNFSRTGVAGFIAIYENEIHLNAELGFLLGMIKTNIEKEIIRQLEEQLS